jgi:class 3 adenylate cyclase
VLDEAAHGLDAERREPLGELRPYPGERRHRRVFVRSRPRSRRTLVHASEAGQRGARTHGEGQGKPTIGTRSDESYTRPVTESRKTVTIVFTDVTGSTALGEQTDPEAMRRIMERYFEEMRTVLEKHGGTVEKFIGDAVMAVFGIPQVHEDDALRAVRAAAEMRDRLEALNEEFERERGIRIAVRTGVNTGKVVAGDPSEGQAFATGDAVNVAARLEQAAEAGEVLLGPLTQELVRDAVRTEATEPLELKGKAAPIEAWRLVEVLPDVPAFTRRIDAPFVGRGDELARLRAALDAARSTASCQLVTVSGPPGIGKSRLVRELIASVGDEARVVVGRCLPYGDGITYWPLSEIVRQVAGADPRAGLRELLGEGSDQALAAERLLGAIGAADEPARTEEIFWATRVLFEHMTRNRPLIAVVDDIHWAEPTLLDLIEYILGFARAPALIVCTARPELFDVRPHWPRAGLVELEALGEQDSATLIDALLVRADLAPTVRERVRERAEGNPLFVEQMLALASEDGESEAGVPATIQALLAARLDHLPDDERAVLVRGAVEGRLFHRGAVSGLLAETERDGVPARLLALARKDFVRPDESLFPGDDAFRFVHVLVRDAAYEAAPKELRAELHERFAAWLEERAADRRAELEEIIGYHLERSYRYRRELGEGAPDLALRAGKRLADAGERALVRGDVSAAAKLLRRAADLLPETDPRRLELAIPLAQALADAGQPVEGLQVLADAQSVARRDGLERLSALLELHRSGADVRLDPDVDSERMLEQARAAIGEYGPDDDAVLAAAWERIEDVEWFRGELDAARAAAEKAFFYAGRLGDVRRQAAAEAKIGASAYFGSGHIDQVIAHAEGSVEWARAHGVLSHQAMAQSALGAMAMEQRRFDDAHALREQAWETLRELGLLIIYAAHRSAVGGLPGLRFAEPDELVKRLRESYEILSAAGEKGILSTTAANLAFCLYERGEYEEAEHFSLVSEQAGSADDVVTQVGWRTARAMLLARRGDIGVGEALAREALARALASEYSESKVEAYLSLGEVLRLAGRPDEAEEAFKSALTILERKGWQLSADAARAKLAELQSSGSPSQ